MRNELFLEMLVLGIISIIFNLAIYWLLTGEFPSPKLDHFNKMALGAFLLGASLHFFFEIVGLNESWCRKTYQIKN